MNFTLLPRLQTFALCLICFITPVTAVEFSAPIQDLNLPTFDTAGRTIRQLTAKSGTVSSNSLQLLQGKVEFFSPAGAESTSTTLEFDHAHYTKSTEHLRGDRALILTSKDGTVRGLGFEGALDQGIFTLKSAVQFNSEEFQLTGDHGELRFDPRATTTEAAIKSVVLTGQIVLVGTAVQKQGFDRAETTLARYDAAQGKVFLKLPIVGWKNGEKWLMEKGPEFFEITLAKPSPAPTP